MKIMLLTTHLDMGGISIYVVELARQLKRRGHHPFVVSSGGALERRLRLDGIPHHFLPCRTSSELNPILWMKAWPKLIRLVRAERPQLLHAHTRVTQVLAWATHTLTRIPYVSTCHGLYRYRIGRRLLHCWGDIVMTISQASLDRLVHQYRLAPPNRVVLVWNGVDLERFSEPVRQEDLDAFRQRLGVRGDPVIGAIARLSPVKGLDHLIRAVPGLMQRFPNIQLLLVGDGPAKDDLVRLAYQLGIADRVAICPSVEDTRLPLALMQVFVAPSLEEGFGLATVEAMAVGVPVVVSRVGGLSQVVEHGLSGWVVPPADPEAIRLAVEHLLSDSQLRQNIAQAARKRVQERFDFNRTVLEVEQVYRQAVDPNRR